MALLLGDHKNFFGLGSFSPRADFRSGKWHIDFIVNLADILKPKSYLEIGIYQCGLFNKMIPFCDQLVGVDIDPKAGTFMNKSNKAKFVCTSSKDYLRNSILKNELYDFIFIDGNHSKEQVAQDFTGALSILSDNGVMLLHDTYPKDLAATAKDRCDDGYLAIEQLSISSKSYELMTIPMHPGLTICRKRTRQVNWTFN